MFLYVLYQFSLAETLNSSKFATLGFWNGVVGVLYVGIGIGILSRKKWAWDWGIGSNTLNMLFGLYQLTQGIGVQLQTLLLPLELFILVALYATRSVVAAAQACLQTGAPKSNARADHWQYPTCKVCERGSLIHKKAFRMSGPVVIIGFILLIPSVLGMIASAVMFFGALSVAESESRRAKAEAVAQQQSVMAAQRQYRSTMAVEQEAGAKMRQAAIPASVMLALASGKYVNVDSWLDNDENATTEQKAIVREAEDQVREPFAALIRAAGKMRQAAVPASMIDAVFDGRDADVNAWLTTVGHTGDQSSGAWGLSALLGSGFAIAFGIASFVCGLLGWLLVMKKSVLQCPVCGAVVNAS